jgi:hypothetical protein
MAELVEHNRPPPAAKPAPPAVQLPGRILGVAYEYADLLKLIRARVLELRISHETMDAVCGLPSGYSSKLLCDPPVRRLGVLSLGCVVGALGCVLIVAEDAEQIVKIRPRLALRKHPQHWRYHA